MDRFGETIEDRNDIIYMDRFDLPDFALYKKDRFQRVLEDRSFVKENLPELVRVSNSTLRIHLLIQARDLKMFLEVSPRMLLIRARGVVRQLA